MASLQTTNDELLTATESLRAIAHPLRIQIILLLAQQQDYSVKDIHEALDIQQPVASHHLRILKDKGIVKSQRAGQSTIYQLSNVEYARIIRIALAITV